MSFIPCGESAIEEKRQRSLCSSKENGEREHSGGWWRRCTLHSPLTGCNLHCCVGAADVTRRSPASRGFGSLALPIAFSCTRRRCSRGRRRQDRLSSGGPRSLSPFGTCVFCSRRLSCWGKMVSTCTQVERWRRQSHFLAHGKFAQEKKTKNDVYSSLVSFIISWKAFYSSYTKR